MKTIFSVLMLSMMFTSSVMADESIAQEAIVNKVKESINDMNNYRGSNKISNMAHIYANAQTAKALLELSGIQDENAAKTRAALDKIITNSERNFVQLDGLLDQLSNVK